MGEEVLEVLSSERYQFFLREKKSKLEILSLSSLFVSITFLFTSFSLFSDFLRKIEDNIVMGVPH